MKYALSLFVTVLALFCQTAMAVNPILPLRAFIPDGEPRVFSLNGEQRVFLYGSRDERITDFCGYGHDVWSAPVNDLTQWTNHGEVFHVRQVQDIGYGIVDEQHFGAPDCVYNPVTRRYYLYTFLGAPYAMDGKQGPLPGADNAVTGFEAFGPKCVMAVSDSPAGPFTNPVMCDWPAANAAGTFDPAVLVDEQEDGSVRVYAYWGMKGGDRWAELDPRDMHTIIDPDTRKPDRDACHKTLPEEGKATLFEASSIRKVAEDRYVFICSAKERISALTYFYGTSPRGPWTYGGRIIDTTKGWRGGNNHGSIVKVNGAWFVFYHRGTSNSFNRQAMAEPITVRVVDKRVVIPPVEMTSQGVETNGLPAFRRYPASIVCFRTGKAIVAGAQRNPDGLDPVVKIHNGTVLGYKYLNFGERQLTDADEVELRINLQRLDSAVMKLEIAPPNDTTKRIQIAQCELDKRIPADGEYHEAIIPLTGLNNHAELKACGGLKGKWAVFISFRGPDGDLCAIKEFKFMRGAGHR